MQAVCQDAEDVFCFHSRCLRFALARLKICPSSASTSTAYCNGLCVGHVLLRLDSVLPLREEGSLKRCKEGGKDYYKSDGCRVCRVNECANAASVALSIASNNAKIGLRAFEWISLRLALNEERLFPTFHPLRKT